MDPMVFETYFRPQVWGGRRLERTLGKPLPGEGPVGEAWVLSAQELHVSRVAEGPLRGTPLTELWTGRRDELLGTHRSLGGEFPLLIKYLDCQDLLSIQVHPDDTTAREIGVGDRGKTEAWVVLDARPESRIYAGLLPGVDRAALERHLDAGTVAECLHSFVPEKGECIFLAAGTVHAVGGGVLLAEVQQSSDATFRLFDWNRLGTDGKPRTLHRREALRSIDWSAGPVDPARPAPLAGLPPNVAGQRLAACPHFIMERFQLGGPLDLPYADRLSIWMVLEGASELVSAVTGYRRDFRPGETVLVPASAPSLRWQPSRGPEALVVLGVQIP
jgi:mannose-6-phosphate isomerase